MKKHKCRKDATASDTHEPPSPKMAKPEIPEGTTITTEFQWYYPTSAAHVSKLKLNQDDDNYVFLG